ncbi:beta-N-acetylglucosaminidase domain-containing protein [Streptomyces sp. NPDC059009]|uniref:beta-N-acetylglucosaminidase domain-containing protein n=1 Tax=Streptomyces sp. NPDC059009 TaxID=3346694 RepID=UPI0036A63A66
MHVRRRKGAAAVAVAVIAGTLGSAPTALAAPTSPGTPATTPDADSSTPLPSIWPRPQSMSPRAADQSIPLTDEAVLVAGEDTDPYALEVIRAALREAGARRITRVMDESGLPAGGSLVVRAGGPPGATALAALGAPARGDLPSGGYRLATGRYAGRGTVALDGVGEDGLFHAAQTFRQILESRETRESREPTAAGGTRTLPGLTVRDWPATPVRGLTEGFYGTPWTREQRAAQLDFMGRTKQNRYLYAPGDDLFRQARWREPYPADQRADFRALAERAARNHVTLAWAVAPGQALCMSSDADIRALNRKLDAMWALGARAFQLQFQDVSYSEWHCDEDAETFGSGPRAAAKAQARVANAVARHLAEHHPEARPPARTLSLMPTEYYQDGATEYRTALARELDRRVEVAWTGVGVVPKTITGHELSSARRAFGAHPLVTMDNYPINDFAQDRIFLGPYTGREPAVANRSAALLGNAMEQPTASRIPLFTAADYAWNPREYRPADSWRAAIDDVAGDDAKARGALRALAGNEASSVLGARESAYLRPLMADFWHARSTNDPTHTAASAKALRAAFTVMRETPRRLSSSPTAGLDGLGSEVRPWTAQLARFGTAGETAIDMLRAQEQGDGATAWRSYRELRHLRGQLRSRSHEVKVGEGVLLPFVTRALTSYERWAGLDQKQASRRATAHLPRAHRLAAVTALTDPGSKGSVEAHVPGEGWRRVGPLSETGFTEPTPPPHLRADAVRVTLTEGTVHHVVPWYADTPSARLTLARSEADVEIGGAPQRVTARLLSRRPSTVTGTLRARPPKGIRVTTPGLSTLARGTEIEVPLEVQVPAGTPSGTYDIPVTFENGETRTLSVRAFPRTTGPDLAQATGAKASSSADETPDFPAADAIDGDVKTRWSSPPEDGAWWQLKLPEKARVGQVILRWQDAYATSYRIQTSADGRTWRTAATVRDSKGGRESVRMDAPGTRYVRVQGVKRATRYGYSLWSVEVFAVG